GRVSATRLIPAPSRGHGRPAAGRRSGAQGGDALAGGQPERAAVAAPVAAGIQLDTAGAPTTSARARRSGGSCGRGGRLVKNRPRRTPSLGLCVFYGLR